MFMTVIPIGHSHSIFLLPKTTSKGIRIIANAALAFFCKQEFLIEACFGGGATKDDVGENTVVDVWLVVCRLHLLDGWGADITQILSYARVIAWENMGMDSEKAVTTFR